MSVLAFRAAPRTAALGVAAALVISFASPWASAKAAPDSFAPLVKQVSPAVVNIQVLKQMAAGEDETAAALPPGSPYEEFFRRFAPQPKTPRQVGALGSGFIVDPAGYVVTNNHVAGDAKEIKVVLQDGRKLDGKLIGHDEKTDLALIKVESATPLPSVAWGDSTKSEVGDWVLAVGNPFGLGGTVTAGIISARGRDIGAGPYDDFIQLDAPINQGNSGGPSFNMAGEVIGVNTAIFSPSGGSIGIGFAIPSSLAKPVVEELKARGHVDRGWIGVSVQSLTPEIAFGLGLDAKTEGALVSQIDPAGPAAKSGLAQGDVIVAVGPHKVGALRELPRLIAATKPGERVTLSVLRRGAEISVPVTVGSLPEAKQASASGDERSPARRQSAAVSAAGLALAPLTPQLRQQLDLPAEAHGTLITAVRDGSAAEKAGLAAGDLILEVGGQAARKPGDVERQIAAARDAKRDAVVMLIAREGAERYVGLKLPAAQG